MKTQTWRHPACKETQRTRAQQQIQHPTSLTFCFLLKGQRGGAEGGDGHHGVLQSHGEAHRWRVSFCFGLFSAVSFYQNVYRLYGVRRRNVHGRPTNVMLMYKKLQQLFLLDRLFIKA